MKAKSLIYLSVCIVILDQLHFSLGTTFPINVAKIIARKWGYRESWLNTEEAKNICKPPVTVASLPTVTAPFDQAFSPGFESWPPEKWSKSTTSPFDFTICSYKSQSPINIRYKYSKYNKKYKNIHISSIQNGINSDEIWEIINQSSTLIITPSFSGSAALKPHFEYSFKLKPENEIYKLKAILFRWPDSEHSIDGRKYAMEAQLEFESASDRNQKAFIAIFFKVSENDNADLAAIASNLKYVITEDLTKKVTFTFSSIFPTDISKYYRYTGSLTYPPCTQNVLWIVAKTPVRTVSPTQIRLFQDLKFRYVGFTDSSDNLIPELNNYCQFNIIRNTRPRQRRNKRKVYRSFKKTRIKSDDSNVICFRLD